MPDIFVNGKAKEEKKTTPKKNAVKHFSHPASRMSAFSAFCQNPLGITFQNQDQDEVVLLFLRKSFITNFSLILTTVLLILLPFLLKMVFRIDAVISLFPFISDRLGIIVILFYYLAVFSYFFIGFITWFYNIFIVTNKKVVDVDYADLVYHNVAITKLSHVQDVNYTQSGFIRSLFNYGDLFVQTAADEKNFEAPGVPQPERAANIIGDLIGKEEPGVA